MTSPMTRKARKLRAGIAMTAIVALALVGCSSDGSNEGGDNGNEAGGDKGTIKIGIVPGWTDAITMAHLLDNQLEKQGYNVEIETLGDAVYLYTGVAEGDIDIYASASPDVTQKAHWDRFADQLEVLSEYYQEGRITLAVPDYLEDIQTLDDLAANPDLFDGQIIGIEPGAGQMALTEDVVMPAYGLDENFELVSSSTATMLATLEEAVENEEPIVVTLWEPMWANTAFNLRTLEDPQEAFGGNETREIIATKGFSEEYPEVAEFISKIQLEGEAYESLEALVTEDAEEGEESAAVDEWAADHPDAFEGLIVD